MSLSHIIIKSYFAKNTFLNHKRLYSSYDLDRMKNHIGRTIMGYEFKKIFPNYIPTKIIGNNRNDFKYIMGKNTDYAPFSPGGSCLRGGLYFTDINDIPIFYYDKIYGSDIAFIELIDNEPIYIDIGKCKTKSFEIVKIIKFNEFISHIDNKIQKKFNMSNFY